MCVCAKLLHCVRLSVTPWTVAHQAPLSMGFSRQKYWSGLPCSSPGNLPNPGIEPRSPALKMDSLLTEPPGKPKNTGVGSLSLLQGIFLTQKLNWGLLNCRQSLYQLSYQGSLCIIIISTPILESHLAIYHLGILSSALPSEVQFWSSIFDDHLFSLKFQMM